jgi:PrtD family type I secretion system ABC transporter
MSTDKGTRNSPVAAALKAASRAFVGIGIFSSAVNLLMLAGPLYMLQIYDRVLSSRSIPTLLALSAFLVAAYGFQAALDVVRGRIVVRSAALLDARLSKSVGAAVSRLAGQGRNAGEVHQPVRDLDQLRMFLTSPGPLAIVDLPWVPVFLAICYLVHPVLGALAAVSGVVLLILTIVTERVSRPPSRVLSQDAGLRVALIEANRRNNESIAAMGIGPVLSERWVRINDRFLAATTHSTDVISSLTSISKVVRMLSQSAVLGIGAYLVIQNELTAGSMIAASLMMGRALAPIEAAIGNWRGFVSARQGIRRLSRTLARLQPELTKTELPKPIQSVAVENVTVAAPGMPPRILLKGVNFSITAGEALGIIGPSGAGKTSMMRTLLGIWPPAEGTIRLDGAEIHHWDMDQLGRHIGFVSQGVELFDGTVGENIARMSLEPDSPAVLAAAASANAHDMIQRLPEGYNTRIGEGGAVLSAGQRQRIALARALYGNPFLLILDEPHSNLDGEGEAALQKAIAEAKQRGAAVIMIAHRPSALVNCDKILYVANGTQQDFGPRDRVFQKVVQPAEPVPTPAPLQVVRPLSTVGS